MPLTSDRVSICQANFGLTYHVSYALCCEQMVGFGNKNVLEVGGSLPQAFVFDHLEASTWTALEAPAYEAELQTTGGSVHTGSDIKKPTIGTMAERGYGPMRPDRYRLLWANVENLPESYYGHYDLIFSIAAFEHIQHFPLALDKMFHALKPGGKLFSMFSPIWSAHDGHHLPQMRDRTGQTFNHGQSPIPPWGHLLMKPAELCQYLYQYTDRETAQNIVYYVYQSNHINRLFTEDYLAFVNQSLFKVENLSLTFPSPIPDYTDSLLQQLYPGRQHFQNNGILMVLEKPR